jgi:hypothetical protein
MRRIESLAARLVATAALGLTAASGLTGCAYYELRDCIDDCTLNCKNGYLARRAWLRCGDGCHPFGSPYKDGFIDGYAAVAAGGDGCPPSMPPRGYWSCCNSGPEGQCKVNSYYDGYARGAIAAEAEGVCARIAYHKPACGAGCQVSPGYGPAPAPMTPMPAGMSPAAVPTTMPTGPMIGPPSPPPPSPPPVAPATPADEAYETYNESGLYE